VNGYGTGISPHTPTYSTVNGKRNHGTPPTPSIPAHKFSQTIGPGVRPSSPNFKPKRPSLPRPESPFRKPAPNLAPTSARNLSQSTRGTRPGITPNKTPNFRASSTTRTTSTASSTSHTPRPYSRTGSRLGHRSGALNESVLEEDLTPTAITTNSRTASQSSVPSFSQPLRSPSRLGSAGERASQEELQRLRYQLSERDRRLEEQAASLAEMETSVKELSALLPADGQSSPGKTNSTSDDEDDDGLGQSPAQLRQMLREKNEKISMLTAEFDAHRADFRSTLDSLEMASTETERVYEEQKHDLLAQLDSLQEIKEHRDDFEGVAMQLKQLEDLVAELEEGLEESRRGEAEARGEVEFLRGEVERGRSELKRERDKAAVQVNGGVGTRELEAKDDEIRGLKAIIHRLSEGTHGAASAVGAANGSVGTEELRRALEESQREKEELEQEVESLRRDVAARNGNGNGHTRNESDRTATAFLEKERGGVSRTRSDTIRAPAKLPSRAAPVTNGADAAATTFCEMCASSSHDTLDCTQFQTRRNGSDDRIGNDSNGGVSSVEEPYSPGKENQQQQANGKAAQGVEEDEEKWCALCEKDGHLAFDCPEEQY